MKKNAFTSSVRPLDGWLPPNVILVMKITVFLMIVTMLQVSARSYSQVSLNENNTALKAVLKTIKKQTGKSFFYDNNDIADIKVDVHLTDVSLEQALNRCLKNQPLSYKVVANTVVLKRVSPLDQDKQTQTPFTIKGIVTDEEGPLAGVTVTLKGKSSGTSTDDKGLFSLSGVNTNDVIILHFLGYQNQEVVIKEAVNYNIRMIKSTSNLNQVVVIGYGSAQKKDLTGSVSTINVKEIENVPFATVDNAMAGKAAGVQVTKTDGSPGGAVRIRVRGSSSLLGGNDPLYIIDGVPLQVGSNFISPGYGVGSPVSSSLNNGNPQPSGLSGSFVNGLNSLGGLNVDDIESITILKDASSTAIYGSKAANGVIIITTKRGKKDMKPVITASYSSTVTTPKTPDLLNADQYKMLLTEAATNDVALRTAAGRAQLANVTSVLAPNYFGNANTDWVKEVTRTTLSNNAEVAVQGGGNSSKYFSSLAYNSTPGIVRGTDYNRLSGKINLENQIGSKFTFITNLIIGYTNQDIGIGAYDQALHARPDYTPYNATGGYTTFNAVEFYVNGFQNPVAMLQATNNAKTLSLIGSFSGIYDITKGLQFKSTVSLNSQAYNQRNYLPSFLQTGIPLYGNTANSTGIGSNSNSRLANWFVENTLSYNKTFGTDHVLTALAGTSYETRKTSFFSATATGYPNDNYLTSFSSATTPLSVRGDDPKGPQSYLISYYLRANYAFQDKYLLTFTGRADGSSKFGPDNKYGYFPSGAIAWRISEEKFLKKQKWIDDIKLRGSYGLIGTQNIGDQMYRTLYSATSYAGNSALVPVQLGNEAIKWESTKEADAGLDISLFNGRLTATLDYYNKQTNGALLSLPVAPSSSFTSMLSNAAGIKNTGWEVALQGDVLKTGNFKWNASFNITWNKSIVTKLNANADLSQLGNLTGLEVNAGAGAPAGTTAGNTALIQGQPIGLLLGRQFTGIIQTQQQLTAYKALISANAGRYLTIGSPMYKLVMTGPTNNAFDYNTVIGHGAPKLFGGFTQGFTYKNFDLQFYFTYSYGGHLLWADHVASMEFANTQNANAVMLNRWTPTNTNTNQPILVLGADASYYQSNLDVFSSSYIKLRTLTLNYRFSKAGWMNKAGIKNAGVFVSATNVFTITKYPGNDPETSDDPYSVNGGYFDASNYPTVRTFTLGLKAGF